MPAAVRSAMDRVRTMVSSMSIAQRTFTVLAVVGLLLAALALSSWVSKPTMSPLFAEVSATDASAIVDLLDAEGVPYELAAGGTAVLVPAEQLYTMRLKVAAAGLPADTDGAGYSLLDGMSMTSSEFQQNVTYQRAIEGELAKTVSSIDGVAAATVKLALPEDSVFVETSADPTASVFVQTRAGKELSSAQVQSIVHLVSAGIAGMKPTDVAVINSDGQVLSAVGSTDGTGLSGERTSDYETRVASAVQTMLDRVLGPGNAVVSVTAELDYDQTQRTTEEYTATEDVPPISSATTTEQYTGDKGTSVGGVLGPDNIAVPTGTGSGGEYLNESETVNNAINKSIEQTTTAPGGVRRQSIAVAVNATTAADLNMADVTEMVSAAAGLDADRGDTVSVSSMVFDTSSAETAKDALAEAVAAEQSMQTAKLIREGVIAGVIFLVFIGGVIVMRRRAVRAGREFIDIRSLATDEDELPEIPQPVIEAPRPQASAMLKKRGEIEQFAEEQPTDVAGLLRGWIKER